MTSEITPLLINPSTKSIENGVENPRIIVTPTSVIDRFSWRLIVCVALVFLSITLVFSSTERNIHRNQKSNDSSNNENADVVSTSVRNAKSPHRFPHGSYNLVDLQEGLDLFHAYDFYQGKDSNGSHAYVNYVTRKEAMDGNIANVTMERVVGDIFSGGRRPSSSSTSSKPTEKEEPFVYMSTAPTDKGPRDAVRMEGKKRYDRGLFIIDLRHMPAGCASWPAFWLVDEEDWPVNGEIDIVEGVNKQSVAKTALHSSDNCTMAPSSSSTPSFPSTGKWDSATGVPWKNGTVDNTTREASNCFVYDPRQWINQGCVAVSNQEGTLGTPLNARGGGVFVLEWDPSRGRIRSWVFSPHLRVPENLREAMTTAGKAVGSGRILPEPDSWGLPYGHFPIGDGTGCSDNHFRNMRLVFNTALCGSVSANRFHVDCPELHEKFGSCNNYVASNPPQMDEMYWKIRGVYVYERG